MPNALLSTSDKAGLIPFAQGLAARGWTLWSTGGTARALRDAGLSVIDVGEITGHPEMMDGRVKTLHPAVHAGLLARTGHDGDAAEMLEQGYAAVDLLAVNLYPFEQRIAEEGASRKDAIENIDIGGPAMLRAAAKNHERVWAVCDPEQYSAVLAALDGDAEGALRLRRGLAAAVFARTSAYDGAIARYLGAATREAAGNLTPAEPLPDAIDLRLRKQMDLRYGENPDQLAALYTTAGDGSQAGFRQLQGKELSFNNLQDLDAARFAASAWTATDAAACVIVKHATPCGIAIAPTAAEAFQRAWSTDPTSAFGSVIVFNREVPPEAAEAIAGRFVEVVAAPAFAAAALQTLSRKSKLRLLQVAGGEPDGAFDIRRTRSGFLLQEPLRLSVAESEWRVVTRRDPSASEMADLRFAWRAVASVKSNAILLARDGRALGIGAGQMSRVDASRIAVMKAHDQGHDLSGCALASDAFFPFRDGVDAAAEAGVAAIIQPGGSIRDQEVIAAADEHGVAMLFTGRRLFRH